MRIDLIHGPPRAPGNPVDHPAAASTGKAARRSPVSGKTLLSFFSTG